MSFVKVVLTSLASVITLFLLTKFTGKKQVGELSMFDYINGITIGSIAAEMATADKWEFVDPFISMIVYALAAIAISCLSQKSLVMRKYLTGTTELLYKNGKIYNETLKKSRLDIIEFLSQLRVNGYFDLNDVSEVYMEPNGRFSIIPTENARPSTPKDLNLNPKQTKPAVIVVSDGVFIRENMKSANVTEKTILSTAKVNGANSVHDVFLATVNQEGIISVYLRTRQNPVDDIFQ